MSKGIVLAVLMLLCGIGQAQAPMGEGGAFLKWDSEQWRGEMGGWVKIDPWTWEWIPGAYHSQSLPRAPKGPGGWVRVGYNLLMWDTEEEPARDRVQSDPVAVQSLGGEPAEGAVVVEKTGVKAWRIPSLGVRLFMRGEELIVVREERRAIEIGNVRRVEIVPPRTFLDVGVCGYIPCKR